MTQTLSRSFDATTVTQTGIRPALWLAPNLATEILANLTTTLVYYETMVWQYRQRLLDHTRHQDFWTSQLEQALDACVAEFSCKLDQLEEGQVTQCLQVEPKPINGISKTVGDRWQVRSDNPFLIRSAASRPRRVRQKGRRMKKTIRILIQQETQVTINQLDKLVSDYRRKNRV